MKKESSNGYILEGGADKFSKALDIVELRAREFSVVKDKRGARITTYCFRRNMVNQSK